jgi:hypothetical protein
MIDQRTLDDYAERLCRLAPEMVSGVHVVEIGTLAGLPVHPCCYGEAFTSPFKDTVFGERIPGYRPGASVIALDFNLIEQGSDLEQFHRCIREVCLHELAHLVPHQPPSDDLPATPEIRAFEIRRMQKSVEMPIPDGPADSAHNLSFIRRCLHLFIRACDQGFELPLSSLFGSRMYWRSHESTYLQYAIHEAFEMRSWTFSQIEATPVPPRLAALWEEDIANYHRHKTKENA